MRKNADEISLSEERLEDEKARLESLESNANKRVKDLDNKKASIRTETVNIENLKQELIESGLLDANGQNITDEFQLKGVAREIHSEIKRMDDLIKANTGGAREINSGLAAAHQERSQAQQERDRLSGKIKYLDTPRSQKMEKLKEREADTFQAVTWIQNNSQKFKQAVFEPVALEINVEDKRY